MTIKLPTQMEYFITCFIYTLYGTHMHNIVYNWRRELFSIHPHDEIEKHTVIPIRLFGDMVVVRIRVKEKKGGKIDHNTRGYTLFLVLIILFM